MKMNEKAIAHITKLTHPYAFLTFRCSDEVFQYVGTRGREQLNPE